MTGLDTNVLVRYFTQDDPEQFQGTLTLLNRKGAKFFVPDIVLIELDWVLGEVYDWSKAEIVETIANLMTVHNLLFENEPRLHRALKAVRQGADLSDELIVALCDGSGCKDIATFDKGMIKRHKSFAFTP